MTGRPTRAPLDAYAVCAPGLEELTRAELAGLGVRALKASRGGVSFRGTTRQVFAANLWLRTATRVLLRVGTFEASTFAELQSGARALDLSPWRNPGTPLALRVSAGRSALYHTDAIAERLRQTWEAPAPEGPAGPATPAADDGAPLVLVRVDRNEVTVSVDTSGEPLYKRGWRHDVAKAPLRETVASALLLATGWTPDKPLVDPFCGSGTIPIEAALLASGRPPGFARGFAFFDWPSFEAGTWASLLGEAVATMERQESTMREQTVREQAPVLSIAAADRDTGAVSATTANAQRAGVAEMIAVREASVSDLEPVGDGRPGWLLTNPPYGVRLQGPADLRNLYARLGDVARRRLGGWQAGLLVADRRLAAHTGFRLQPALTVTNGGIETTLLAGRVDAGPRRGVRAARAVRFRS